LKFRQYYISGFNLFEKIDISRLLLLSALVLFLALINWGLEAYKWSLTIYDIENLPFLKCLKAVIIGISFNIITPNRTGEIAVRSIVLKEGNRRAGMIATGVGSISQLVITISCGLISFIFFPILEINKSITTAIIFINILLVFLFFNLSIISNLIKKNSFLIRVFPNIDFLKNYKKNELLVLLFLSFLRYLVFTFQFFLLTQIFKINISVFETFTALSIMYLIVSIIPTTTLAEIGLRASVAVTCFSFYTSMEQEIMFSTFLLWIINLGLPAIIGIYLLNKKVKEPEIINRGNLLLKNA